MTSPLRTRRLAVLLAAVALALAACGDDDGADVRDIGGSGSGSGSGSASAPASGSASGSASAPASGSASGTGHDEHEECVATLPDPKPATTVDVALQEYAVLPAAATAPAGTVGFVARNTGNEHHELVVVKADDPAALPTEEDGSADLDALGDAVVGEIHAFDGGDTCADSFDLTAGSYVLLCNVVEEDENGEKQAHYRLGMRTAFTVR